MSIVFERVRPALALISLVSIWGMTGCGTDLASADQPFAVPGVRIHGAVHGGVYPIQDATIRLMETQSNGYGGAAKQLLQTTSDSGGYFTFPDTGWSCDSNQFAYITVTSGHTATNSSNNNVGQIGVIGNCGKVLANKAEIDAVEVFVSELSTIAAAYTLRSFITIDNTNAASGQQIFNISAPANNNAASGSCTATAPVTCSAAGLAHAFQNAYNLVDSVNFGGALPTGQARATPPTNGFAYVPQEAINTLGNILQSCVDSSGGTVGTYSTYTAGGTGSTRCGDLFYWATPPNGTPPTNTLQAAMNMAQYPANNVVSLFDLQPRAVFFSPTLSAAPNDLTISLFYLTETFGSSTGALTNPVAMALDANDDAFILTASANGSSNTETAVLSMASSGSVLFAGPVNTTYLYPQSITVDASGSIWFTNNDPSTTANSGILAASPSTGVISMASSLPYASGLAVDQANNVWASVATATPSAGFGSFNQYAPGSLKVSGTLPSRVSPSVNMSLGSVVIDGNQNVWSVSASSGGTQAVGWQNRGTVSAPAFFNPRTISLSSHAGGYGIAVDKNAEAYFPVSGQIDDANFPSTDTSHNLAANNQGTYTQSTSTFLAPNQAQMDGAGNIFWTDLEASGRLYQFVPTSGGGVSGGTLATLLPCYPAYGSCYVPAVSNLRGMQIDSTGALWSMAASSYAGYPIGVVIETFGVGAPTWPQKAAGKPGVMPQ